MPDQKWAKNRVVVSAGARVAPGPSPLQVVQEAGNRLMPEIENLPDPFINPLTGSAARLRLHVVIAYS
jgi:hypothetical protein